MSNFGLSNINVRTHTKCENHNFFLFLAKMIHDYNIFLLLALIIINFIGDFFDNSLACSHHTVISRVDIIIERQKGTPKARWQIMIQIRSL
jgi:hypothetical protein